MPSDRWESRAALAFLCVAAAIASPASAQTQTGLRRLGAPPPSGLPSVSAGARQQLTPEPPPEQKPLMRGALETTEPRVTGAANYGAPRKRIAAPRVYPPRRGLSPPPFSPKNALPALEPYRASAVAKRAAKLRRTMQPGPPEEPPPTTVAAIPTIKVKPRPKLETNPYDPIGVGVGSLRLSPFVEAGFGYDDNPNRLGGAHRGSKLLRGDAGFDLKSDWSQHELLANLRVGYSEYVDYSAANRPDGAGALTARYDVTRDTQLDLKARFSLDTQRPGAPAISSGLPNVAVINRPIIFGAQVAPGVTHRFNRLEVSLRGTFDRVIYENARYSDGTSLDLARTSYNGYGGGGRVSYELTPDLKPFVEGNFDWRVHDSLTDPFDYRRDSRGFAARGGAKVNFSELLKGEASGGYAERTYDDPRLPKLRGPTIDASLIYTPSALTTVKLTAGTTLNETTTPGASGMLQRSFGVQISHDLLRNLNVTAQGAYLTNDYQGADISQRGYTAGVKLTYRITRSIALRGSFSHEQLSGGASSADYTANVYLVGLRFQL